MLTMTDLFCGAGGSSTGATQVAGVQVDMAVNHWALAVETHNTNHPKTRHDCADISQVDPRRYPKTDILWASPECTNHSIAGRGRLSDDEASERSRATMWDIPRFAEHHNYRAIILENVVDIMRWTPLPGFVHAMDNLGYDLRWVFANAMHATGAGDPAAQNRTRAFGVLTKKGDRKPDLRKWTDPWAYCQGCYRMVQGIQYWKKPGQYWGRYGAQYTWRCPRWAKCRTTLEPSVLPASSVIDWALPAQRIGDKQLREFTNKTTGEVTSGHLSPKTMGRIAEGLRRYYSVPQLVPTGGTWDTTTHPVTNPMRTRLTREMEGLLIPVEGREGKIASSVHKPLRTQTARNETGLLIPGSFVVPLRANNRVKSVDEPFDTFAASGNHHALASPSTPLPEDCQFRMLDPHEIMRGMAFPDTYTMLGTKRDRVKLAGNAVCPPNARDLISAVAEALAA